MGIGYLAYRKRDLAAAFRGEGCLVQGRSGSPILSLFLPSRMSRGRCAPEEELVRVLVGGERSRDAAGLPGPELRKLVEGEAAAILRPGRAAVDFEGFSHPNAIPQLAVGHMEGLARAQEAFRRGLPGLILAGTGFAGAGIENAIKEGKRAAVEIRGRLARPE
jgi:oxygen-dependent protoporphyrinogen oxidase